MPLGSRLCLGTRGLRSSGGGFGVQRGFGLQLAALLAMALPKSQAFHDKKAECGKCLGCKEKSNTLNSKTPQPLKFPKPPHLQPSPEFQNP